MTGFSLPDDALHAPDESYRLVALEQGEKAARALYEELAALLGQNGTATAGVLTRTAPR